MVFRGAVRGVAGFWAGYLGYGVGGLLIFAGTVKILKLLRNVPAVAFLVPTVFIATFLIYHWSVGYLMEQIERIGERFWF